MLTLIIRLAKLASNNATVEQFDIDSWQAYSTVFRCMGDKSPQVRTAVPGVKSTLFPYRLNGVGFMLYHMFDIDLWEAYSTVFQVYG